MRISSTDILDDPWIFYSQNNKLSNSGTYEVTERIFINPTTQEVAIVVIDGWKTVCVIVEDCFSTGLMLLNIQKHFENQKIIL